MQRRVGDLEVVQHDLMRAGTAPGLTEHWVFMWQPQRLELLAYGYPAYGYLAAAEPCMQVMEVPP